MKTLLKPIWIFLIIVIPQAFLIALYASSLAIIKTLLTKEGISLIIYFSASLITAILCFSIYSFILILKKKQIHALWTGLFLLVFYSVFLVLYLFNDKIIPWTVPGWMINREDLFLYVITFIMPAILYGLLLLVVHFTKEEKNQKIWVNFAIMGGIPLGWYLFYLVIIPLFRTGSFLPEQAFLVLFLASTIAFFFFLVRAFYLIFLKREGFYNEYGFIIKVLFGFVLPLIGLSVNLRAFGENVFGNFSHPIFFILALINGVVLCIPRTSYFRINVGLFLLKTITLSFTLYFFLVFLPFLPFAMLAIILLGAGFLMLTPTVLLVIHIQELHLDVQELKGRISRRSLTLIGVAAFLVLPVSVTLSFWMDRLNLHTTLNYVYEPDLEKKNSINLTSLKSTVENIKRNKSSSRDFFNSNGQTPYLSTYYNWLVFHNLTLSREKIELIEKIFYGKFSETLVTPNQWEKDSLVTISNIGVNSRYDQKNKCWRSWVNLNITNCQNTQAEYSTQFKLPEGCFIANYYLEVEGRKKYGLLAEKRSAQWIYQEIRNVRRDPGILFYVGGNDVNFRVFPFAADEERKTGIEFIHKEAVKLQLDDQVVQLGTSGPEEVVETEEYTYIPARIKKALPKVTRLPYLHFIVDCSDSETVYPTILPAGTGSMLASPLTKNEKLKKYQQQIDNFVEKHASLVRNAKISFVNHQSDTRNFNKNWKEEMTGLKFEGGFFLERCLKEELMSNYKSSQSSYPVFIVLTEDWSKAISTGQLKDIAFAYPEGELIYQLQDNILKARSINNFTQLTNHPVDSLPVRQVHLWTDSQKKKVWLNADNDGALVLKNKNISSTSPRRTDFESALQLQARWRFMNINPHRTNETWLPLIQDSFTSGIMTPLTSYIVLETEAQEKALLVKQKKILSAKNSLDITDEEVRMSEPGLWIGVVLLALLLLVNSRKKAKVFR